jgi:hypothetical protein
MGTYRTCCTVLPFFSASTLIDSSLYSGESVEPRQEYAVTWMPFDVQYSRYLGLRFGQLSFQRMVGDVAYDGLLGWSYLRQSLSLLLDSARTNLNLVDRWRNLVLWMSSDSLEMLDAKVGHSKVADFASSCKLLHLNPDDGVSNGSASDLQWLLCAAISYQVLT